MNRSSMQNTLAKRDLAFYQRNPSAHPEISSHTQKNGFARYFPVFRVLPYTQNGIDHDQSIFSTLWTLFRIFPCRHPSLFITFRHFSRSKQRPKNSASAFPTISDKIPTCRRP